VIDLLELFCAFSKHSLGPVIFYVKIGALLAVALVNIRAIVRTLLPKSRRIIFKSALTQQQNRRFETGLVAFIKPAQEHKTIERIVHKETSRHQEFSTPNPHPIKPRRAHYDLRLSIFTISWYSKTPLKFADLHNDASA
jgi:hypothetical protein